LNPATAFSSKEYQSLLVFIVRQRMLRSPKRLARKSKAALVLYKIFDNWRMKRRLKAGIAESLHGSTHSLIVKNTSESVQYINRQFDDYVMYSGLPRQEFRNRRILELGYGDNVGVALKFLSVGAAQVVCLDRFQARRDVSHELEIYKFLKETIPIPERPAFEAAIELNHELTKNPARLFCLNGLELEEAVQSVPELKIPFDFVLSRAVIEEIHEPDSLFRAADKILVPGGHMIHKIDLSDYGIFSGGGMHPLTFLTLPEFVYQMMSSHSGIPNRKRVGFYRQLMKEIGYESTFFVTSMVGKGPVEPHVETLQLHTADSRFAISLVDQIRSKLSKPYRAMSDEELIVDGIFLVARKPTS